MIRSMCSVITVCFLTCFSTSIYSQTENEPCTAEQWYVTDFPKEKAQLMQDLIEIIQEKPSSLAESGITLKEDDFQYFKIEGTEQMVVVKSKSYLRKECEDAL
jgi:hypothetical protein